MKWCCLGAGFREEQGEIGEVQSYRNKRRRNKIVRRCISAVRSARLTATTNETAARDETS